MVMVYVSLIERGLRTFESVPSNLQAEVKKLFNERNPDNQII